MKGIILAAGRGSRLEGLTAERPKPLVELAGKPLFEWQLSAMQQAGIEDVTVITGYRGEQFARYPIARIVNPFWASSNMVRTLLQADSVLQQDDCLVSYGDIVYHSEIVGRLATTEADIALSYDQAWWALWSQRFSDPLSDAESFQAENGLLVDIGRRVASLDEIQGQYMGLLKFTPVGWQQVKNLLGDYSGEQIDKLDMTGLLSALLKAGVTITTVATNGRWLEVDDTDDINLYQQQLEKTDDWLHDWRDER